MFPQKSMSLRSLHPIGEIFLHNLPQPLGINVRGIRDFVVPHDEQEVVNFVNRGVIHPEQPAIRRDQWTAAVAVTQPYVGSYLCLSRRSLVSFKRFDVAGETIGDGIPAVRIYS